MLLVAAGLVALGCGGLFGPGDATVVGATPGACGGATLRIQARGSWFERDLQIATGDGPPVRTVPFPPRTEELFVDVPLPSGRTTPITASFEGGRYSHPVDVTVPPIDAAVTTDLDAPIPADADPRLPLRVLGPCVGTASFAVSAILSGDRPLVVQEPTGDDGTLTIELPDLRQGTWSVEVILLHAPARGTPTRIERRVLPVVIGPPCLDQDGDGHLACEGDCDDADPAVHPGAEDVVGDGIDSDCDGVNGRDADRDSFEDAAVGGDDCDDGDPRVPAGPDGAPDADGDGAYAWTALDWDCDGVAEQAPGPFDCDDSDPDIPTTEKPRPNGIDDDCDGLVDEGTVAFDDDGDGFSEQQGDCNDADDRVAPGAPEHADCRDNDCDGQIDEGVERPRQDDRYEPNDETPYELAGAVRKKPVLGFPGGHKATRQSLVLTTRDASDVERFSLWTHDGAVDGWHVTADVLTMGDRRSYDVIIEGGGRTRSAVIEAPGGTLRMTGQGFSDNTGTYTIEIRPREGQLDWCPLEVVISSG